MSKIRAAIRRQAVSITNDHQETELQTAAVVSELVKKMKRGRYEKPTVQKVMSIAGRLREETPTMLRKRRRRRVMTLDDKVEAAQMIFIDKEQH